MARTEARQIVMRQLAINARSLDGDALQRKDTAASEKRVALRYAWLAALSRRESAPTGHEPVSIPPWSCARCTFDNEGGVDWCEICGQPGGQSSEEVLGTDAGCEWTPQEARELWGRLSSLPHDALQVVIQHAVPVPPQASTEAIDGVVFAGGVSAGPPTVLR